MVYLTKEDIIGGIKNTHDVSLPMYGEDVELAVREITDLEYNQFISTYRDLGAFDMISSLKGNDRKTKEDKTQVKTSMKKVEETKFNAKVNLLYNSLDNSSNPQKFTKQDIQNLKSGAIDILVDATLAFSGLDSIDTLEADMNEFREEE